MANDDNLLMEEYRDLFDEATYSLMLYPDIVYVNELNPGRYLQFNEGRRWAREDAVQASILLGYSSALHAAIGLFSTLSRSNNSRTLPRNREPVCDAYTMLACYMCRTYGIQDRVYQTNYTRLFGHVRSRLDAFRVSGELEFIQRTRDIRNANSLRDNGLNDDLWTNISSFL